jgi:diguanylate cyclase
VNDETGFAHLWARAVTGTSFVAMGPAEVDACLTALTAQLLDALHGDPFDPAGAGAVGAALVDAHFTSPETLGRTVELLGRGLPGVDTAGLRARLGTIQGRLAAGFTAALRDRTLAEQEAIGRATMVAHRQAEQALRSSREILRHQALHDPLTGLPNRTLLLECLDAAFTGGGRVAVCFLDLDRFKEVNDRLGHAAGDELLITVASRLAAALSPSGHLVARMGGDEFVILARDTTGTADAIGVATTALDALAAPVGLAGHRLSITASVGVVERPVADTSPQEMLRAADVTMYWAKSAGPGRWALFDPERNAREMARYELSATMLAAVDRGEFMNDYQPLVSLSTGALLGMEALVRWDHPQLGLLPPGEFIGLAETTGLIVPLGRWVLWEACRQASTWPDRWPDLAAEPPYVSVNLAVRQALEPGFADDVAAALRATGLEPGRLQLEITESAVMRTADGPLDTLNTLRDMGVGIAIDDFGTGYSNLSYLRSLPVRCLKIDGAFVRGLATPGASGSVDEQIVTALVSMAHALGLTVTAEGVETAAQADRLAAIGADAGQGVHFAAPGAPDVVTQGLIGRRRHSGPRLAS